MPRISKYSSEIRGRAISLRSEERMSTLEISNTTGISIGALRHILEPYPLNEEELANIAKQTSQKSNAARWKKWNDNKENRIKECIRLRVEERKSLNQISLEMSISKGTISSWLRPYPLTEKEVLERRQNNILKVNTSLGRQQRNINTLEKSLVPPKKFLDKNTKTKIDKPLSDFAGIIGKFSREEKGRIAEAAVLFKLALNKFFIFGPVFYGAKDDWIVGRLNSSKVARIQVKFAKIPKRKGDTPIVSIRCSNGARKQRRYNDTELDFLVGYDMRTNTCYVFSKEDIASNKWGVSINSDYEERWDKISSYLL